MKFTPGDRIPRSIPQRLAERVQHWDDERKLGNSLIVTLHYGWSFDPAMHEGVMGFDTVAEARSAIKRAGPCRCKECEAAR